MPSVWAFCVGCVSRINSGEERVFLGSSGDYTCALLTNKSAVRQGVIDQFRSAWKKPGPCPRVERIYGAFPLSN